MCNPRNSLPGSAEHISYLSSYTRSDRASRSRPIDPPPLRNPAQRKEAKHAAGRCHQAGRRCRHLGRRPHGERRLRLRQQGRLLPGADLQHLLPRGLDSLRVAVRDRCRIRRGVSRSAQEWGAPVLHAVLEPDAPPGARGRLGPRVRQEDLGQRRVRGGGRRVVGLPA